MAKLSKLLRSRRLKQRLSPEECSRIVGGSVSGRNSVLGFDTHFFYLERKHEGDLSASFGSFSYESNNKSE